MKLKTINKVLNGKFDALTKSIKDESVRKLVEANTIITGGCIASMLLQEEVNDYDIYFRNVETAEAVARYYVGIFMEEYAARQDVIEERKGNTLTEKDLEVLREKMQVVVSGGRVQITMEEGINVSATEEGYKLLEKDDADEPSKKMTLEPVLEGNEYRKKKEETYQPVLVTDNAITLSDDVQLVIRFQGDPAQIHEFYDFVHCTNYWTSWDRKTTTNKAALESLLSKELRYVGSQYPICSIIRIRKFLKRGWTINAGQILKMVLQVTAMVTPQTPEDLARMSESLFPTTPVEPTASTHPAPAPPPAPTHTPFRGFESYDSGEEYVPRYNSGTTQGWDTVREEVPDHLAPIWALPGAKNLLLSELSLLQDQIMGVDAVYFREVIRLLQDEDHAPTMEQISACIDEIF